MTGRKALIVGAGPGGLATALRLSHRGYEVEMVIISLKLTVQRIENEAGAI